MWRAVRAGNILRSQRADPFSRPFKRDVRNPTKTSKCSESAASSIRSNVCLRGYAAVALIAVASIEIRRGCARGGLLAGSANSPALHLVGFAGTPYFFDSRAGRAPT